MPANEHANKGTCLVDQHNERYNDHVDSLEARIAGLEAAAGVGVTGLAILAANVLDQSAEVGAVINVPAGITSGRISNNFIVTAMNLVGVRPMDQIVVTFHGDPAVPTNPATRRVAALPGTDIFTIYVSGATGEPVDWTWIKRS